MKHLRSILAYAFVGWALCAATMGVAMALGSLESALIIHALAAPIIFFLVSLSYFSRKNRLSPLGGAMVFVAFVMAIDFFVVALMINRSLEIFTTVLGTWLPFALIFGSSYLAGRMSVRSASRSVRENEIDSSITPANSK